MATPPSRFKDVVGQFPQLKSYNHGLLVFPLDSETSQQSITSALEEAIAQIVAKVPWLGGQVVQESETGENPGFFKAVPLPSGLYDNKILYVRDCTELCPSYAELAPKGAPVSMLDGQLLCPFPGFPLSYDAAKIGPPPPVAVQASFIKGGLVLNFSNQHNMMDASGVFAFMALLAMALQGKELDPDFVTQANMDRAKVIPLLNPGEPIRDHSHLLKPAHPPTTKPPPGPAEWAFFRLSRAAVPQIKASASKKEEFVPSVEFVSSNDALCAFYWTRLAAVRVANGSVEPSSVSKFLRAIDIRAAVGVPPGYMGQMVYHAASRLSYRELAGEKTLSAVASRMRADLNESNNEWAVRSYATFLDSVPDMSQLVYGGGLDLALDIGSSSISQMATRSLDFGILGQPTFVRRPKLVPVPGLMYIYPPEGDAGDLPFLVCLNEKDMEGLKSDKEWSAFAQFIG
ncbi:hypothetical protein GQ53DRAFT_740405 [Thozetella sp. PMI_491]|nr:hypothetical protein GQ53DRAFT_740405 [Thozetella sp. PMI_491]